MRGEQGKGAHDARPRVGEPESSMDAVRVRSTRTVAAALLNKGDWPVTDGVGRVLTTKGRYPFCAGRRPSQPSVLLSQHTLPMSFGTTSYDPEEPQFLSTSAGWGRRTLPPDTLKPTAEALGAVPILMAVNELFDALQIAFRAHQR